MDKKVGATLNPDSIRLHYREENGLQMKWVRELMEQSRIAKPQLLCVCDCDPRALPALVLKRLARGRVTPGFDGIVQDGWRNDRLQVAGI
jgi:hypothetical protein